ncbi:hypothetical protein F5887DRAFT_999651 [Amanita rubescens]|nr:hypothetical protein F5887DRAFT_999651 [Amanita rubescens]
MHITTSEVAETAQRAIDTCIIGSLACAAWGMKNRTPKDVDIVVLDTSPADEERLKREIVARDPNFYLVNAQTPFATYKVLWRRTGTILGRCKIDILAIGTLDIPNVPVERVIRKPIASRNLPVMPFIPLLYLKVQGWVHHRVADKKHIRAKVTQDYSDIQELLRIAKEKGHKRKIGGRQIVELNWMPRSFVEIAKQHVRLYTAAYPELSFALWKDVMY